MNQLSFFEPPIWTITNLNRYLRELFESNSNLQELWVQGEVSNYNRPTSGHIYFTLKDSASALRCVMWRTAANRQTYLPRDGDAIEVHGSISIYEVTGQYQLYADLIRPSGEGVLYQEFLRLKARLEREGLFDQDRKRALPHWPQRIGIVTSPTGAALRDMLNTIRRRYGLVQVILAPTPVQGTEAPAGIIAALNALARVGQPDIILLARGGGSIEDLWAFNDEQVARAICACPVPVISGVGHETDFTIADFVSDLRAPTPTAAAELATPDGAELRSDLYELNRQMGRAVQERLNSQRWELQRLGNRLALRSPQTRVQSDRQRLDEWARRLEISLDHWLQLRWARLHGLEQRLASLNPLAVLGRGYSMVTRPDQTLIRSVSQVQSGERLQVHVSDGTFEVDVARGQDEQH